MKASTRLFYAAAVSAALVRIAGALDEALDLAALAREAALSPLHFHHIFRGLVGETPLELHRRLRMERAARALVEGSAAITTIAFAAGYETHESFTRAFAQLFGDSPSAFRQRARTDCGTPRGHELAARSGIHVRSDGRIHIDELSLEPMKDVMHEIEITQLPTLRLATVHHVGPYMQIGQAFEKLGELAGRAGLLRPGAQMIAMFYDDPETKPAAELESDAGITIEDGVALPGALGELRIAAGRYAKAVHRGPYAKLPDAWARLMGQWLPASGHRLGAGATFELYRNTPQDTAPEALITELYVPLAE